jgi:glycosyltransferase involved in cell wall biosynthesis
MLSWEYTPHLVGGLGKHVVELLPELIDQGVEVHLVTPRFKEGDHEELLRGVEWDAPPGSGQVIELEEDEEAVRVPAGGPISNNSRVYRIDPHMYQIGNFYTNTVQTNVLLEQAGQQLFNHFGHFDLIHAHDWLVSFAAIALKHSRRVPLLSTIHATEMGRNHGHLWEQMQRDIHQAEWNLVYESWRTIACSHYMSWEIQTYFGAPPGKIDVIPNGVDTTPFDRLDRGDLMSWRDQLARRDEKIVFYVGRLVWEKGLQVLVDAAPQIVSIYPNVRFVIAGGGDFRYDLAARARHNGVGDWFMFPGRISDEDRNRLYKVADVAVFPSLYEPFGIVALEAMAAGTPVVTTDVGGLNEVVDLHHTGIKVHPNDPGSLAWGILHTLVNPQWAAQRAQNAYRVVREQFNWHRIARMTNAVYERVAHEARAGDWAYGGTPDQGPSAVPYPDMPESEL